jgi:hypothetical protein
LYSCGMMYKNENMSGPASILSFQKKNIGERIWHGNCNKKDKSDTLISFLLKKVCFVPQSGPFSISCFMKPHLLAVGPH